MVDCDWLRVRVSCIRIVHSDPQPSCRMGDKLPSVIYAGADFAAADGVAGHLQACRGSEAFRGAFSIVVGKASCWSCFQLRLKLVLILSVERPP